MRSTRSIGAGFAEVNHNWSGVRSLGLGELPLRDDTMVVDLHWHLVTFAHDRCQLPLHTAELMAHRVPLALGSVPAWSLADDDVLAHLILHTATTGGRQLIHLRDVHVVASAVDWPAASEQIRLLGLERTGAAVLDRSERLFGPAGPDPRAPDLHHAPWRAANAGFDRAWIVLGLDATIPSRARC